MARSEKRGSEARLEKRVFKVKKRGKVKKKRRKVKKKRGPLIYSMVMFHSYVNVYQRVLA